jgi:hypothetical protein
LSFWFEKVIAMMWTKPYVAGIYDLYSPFTKSLELNAKTLCGNCENVIQHLFLPNVTMQPMFVRAPIGKRFFLTPST